jgi:hypothetical protein
MVIPHTCEAMVLSGAYKYSGLFFNLSCVA